jgi:hypothetical protein
VGIVVAKKTEGTGGGSEELKVPKIGPGELVLVCSELSEGDRTGGDCVGVESGSRSG